MTYSGTYTAEQKFVHFLHAKQVIGQYSKIFLFFQVLLQRILIHGMILAPNIIPITKTLLTINSYFCCKECVGAVSPFQIQTMHLFLPCLLLLHYKWTTATAMAERATRSTKVLPEAEEGAGSSSQSLSSSGLSGGGGDGVGGVGATSSSRTKSTT
jgi:uncharacterized membrane protein YgcG